jgi:hypothetical protein
VIRIDGRQASTGTLPGRALHGRELIKYAGPLDAITVNRTRDGEVPLIDPAQHGRARIDAEGIAALAAGEGEHRVRFELRPSFPDVTHLADGQRADGQWRILAVGVPPLTGGRWSVQRQGAQVTAGLEVTERWRPGPLPPLLRAVTTIVPVFRRWPTTYRWEATITLDDPLTMVSGWQRTGARDDSYRRATGSAG